MKEAVKVSIFVAVLYLGLAVCVLGRPQPSTATSPPVEVLHKNAWPTSSSVVGFQLHFPTVEVPWRRSLKGGGGGGGGKVKVRGGGGGGGGGGTNSKVIIIIIVSIVTSLLLAVGVFLWSRHKKEKNPNWRFADYLKRKKPAGEKAFTSAKIGVNPDAASEHKMEIDVPRLDHTAKSRKQVSLSHEYKNSTSVS